MITQNEIVQLSNDLGISEREARFMLAIEDGEIDGDIISGPSYNYVVKERSGANIPLSSPAEASEDRAAGSLEHSNGVLPHLHQSFAQKSKTKEVKAK